MEKKSSKKTTSKSKSTTAKKTTKNVSKVDVVKEEKVVKEDRIVESSNSKKEKKGLGLFLPLFLTLVIVSVISWFITSGVFNGAEFTGGTKPVRIGISNFFESILAGMNGVYQSQVIFLAMVGIFYGIVSKTDSYKAMISKFAKSFVNKKNAFMLIVSALITLLASFLTQPLVLVLFVPMIYSIAKELKLNKVSSMLITFGALCVGIMGSTFGGFGIDYLTQNLNITIKDGVIYRFIILLIGYFLINGFVLLFNKKNKNSELVEDNFTEVKETKAKAWPMITLFAGLFVLVILGFIAYKTVFDISVFNDFHEWLTTKVVVGEGENEVAVFGALLGSAAAPFGSWDLYNLSYVLFIILIFVKFIAKIKFSELFDNALDGLKVMAKPMILVTFAYALFVITYNNNSPLTSNIINALNQGEKFSPYLNALTGFIGAFLHVDFEYSGFLLGGLYAAKYASSSNQIVAIASSMNGFASLFVPTSVLMLTGLSMTNLSYKSWLKAIWKFLIALLIVLLLIFTIMSFM